MADLWKIHGAIHLATASAALVGAGMAQVPAPDSLLLVPIQTTMVIAIGAAHGHTIDKSAALSLLGTMPAVMVGREASKYLVGCFPGVGNVINASTAAAITEAMGWAAHAYFDNLPPANK
jgi:uncharacterized protein (DUF697 family)